MQNLQDAIELSLLILIAIPAAISYILSNLGIIAWVDDHFNSPYLGWIAGAGIGILVLLISGLTAVTPAMVIGGIVAILANYLFTAFKDKGKDSLIRSEQWQSKTVGIRGRLIPVAWEHDDAAELIDATDSATRSSILEKYSLATRPGDVFLFRTSVKAKDICDEVQSSQDLQDLRMAYPNAVIEQLHSSDSNLKKHMRKGFSPTDFVTERVAPEESKAEKKWNLWNGDGSNLSFRILAVSFPEFGPQADVSLEVTDDMWYTDTILTGTDALDNVHIHVGKFEIPEGDQRLLAEANNTVVAAVNALFNATKNVITAKDSKYRVKVGPLDSSRKASTAGNLHWRNQNKPESVITTNSGGKSMMLGDQNDNYEIEPQTSQGTRSSQGTTVAKPFRYGGLFKLIGGLLTLFFFLPWATVSCAGAGSPESFSGWTAMTGRNIAQGWGVAEHVNGSFGMIFLLLIPLALFLLTHFHNRLSWAATRIYAILAALSLIGFIALLIFRSGFNSRVQAAATELWMPLESSFTPWYTFNIILYLAALALAALAFFTAGQGAADLNLAALPVKVPQVNLAQAAARAKLAGEALAGRTPSLDSGGAVTTVVTETSDDAVTTVVAETSNDELEDVKEIEVVEPVLVAPVVEPFVAQPAVVEHVVIEAAVVADEHDMNDWPLPAVQRLADSGDAHAQAELARRYPMRDWPLNAVRRLATAGDTDAHTELERRGEL